MPAPKRNRATLSFIALALATEGPPTEFRIFVSGWNDTENGRFLFDAKAAKQTLAAYQKWGVDLAIDLEHQMLEEGIAPDPTAKDARGWCNLELRDDGSLWAVNVKWTDDGAARLSEKRQRYISPAFEVDEKTSRVKAILNIAIVAMPATRNTPALVAASRSFPAVDRRKLAVGPSFDDVRSILNAALAEKFPPADPASCSGPWIVAVYDASVVYQNEGTYYEIPYSRDGGAVALSGEPVEVVQTYAPSAAPATETPAPAPADATTPLAKEDPMPKALRLELFNLVMTSNKEAAVPFLQKLAASAAPMLPKALSSAALEAVASGDKNAALDLLKQILSALVGGGDPDAATEDAPPPAGDAGADEATEATASVALAKKITGKETAGEAMAELERLAKVAIDLETREQELFAGRAALEVNERRNLVAQLVKLGVEIPATAWADAKGTVPCARLAGEPIADLRTRVGKLVASGIKPKGAPLPPKTEAGGDAELGLDARELAICKETNCEPATFAMLKKRRANGAAPKTV